ncbi:hypothetical protein BL250_03605 [Erwinia sp. OLTSP20]|uniref:hypothetical protein n=1 Tax=unclassified Erwinia TaxID=2622719 RepID=UPI000C1914E9|nr:MULTISPECIES: hypothetical protein [unclassified Erwinia]PIJ51540.1 hypothetical protein BV501_03640 [Erwinia sp. OAMSP11]PIJ75874.1 hypothetical protein BK416_00615 [Erwinia sp. OLSSP12]PIJ83450.1 hypothetical protein BLD47_04635 [Erwinia sp. OLCASP19]PIJ86283.1 hypothetical protein BLD46_04065 [Erwinia sp. OLMTSP26]PIJ88474.1 hypothetical protein BLD49_01805 [Erwinia sp. OLMDSP33]
MKGQLACVLTILLLAGCTAHQPGAFERIDEDTAVNTVQYRYDPLKVDNAALQKELRAYCQARGFDKVEALRPQSSNIPGLVKTWYQCNYAIKS